MPTFFYLSLCGVFIIRYFFYFVNLQVQLNQIIKKRRILCEYGTVECIVSQVTTLNYKT